MNISDLGKILDNDLKKYYDVVLINGIWGADILTSLSLIFFYLQNQD